MTETRARDSLGPAQERRPGSPIVSPRELRPPTGCTLSPVPGGAQCRIENSSPNSQAPMPRAPLDALPCRQAGWRGSAEGQHPRTAPIDDRPGWQRILGRCAAADQQPFPAEKGSVAGSAAGTKRGARVCPMRQRRFAMARRVTGARSTKAAQGSLPPIDPSATLAQSIAGLTFGVAKGWTWRAAGQTRRRIMRHQALEQKLILR